MSKEHDGRLALKACPGEEAGRREVSCCLLSENKAQTSLAWTCCDDEILFPLLSFLKQGLGHWAQHRVCGPGKLIQCNFPSSLITVRLPR